MGLFDQLAGQVLGALGTEQQDAGAQAGLLGNVMGMIDSAGGVPALLQKLRDSGLGDQVASWIGSGENLGVSGAQIAGALGPAHLEAIAGQAGLEPGHAAAGLAQLLPQIIDKLTPEGQLPADGLLSQGLHLLKSSLQA